MKSNQLVLNAAAYAKPCKGELAFKAIMLVIASMTIQIILIALYFLIFEDADKIDLSIFLEYKTSMLIVSAIFAVSILYYLYFRKSIVRKRQLEYLVALYEEYDDKISETAESLQLLRTVPEIAPSTWTEQEHIDDINANIKMLTEIQKAIETFDE